MQNAEPALPIAVQHVHRAVVAAAVGAREVVVAVVDKITKVVVVAVAGLLAAASPFSALAQTQDMQVSAEPVPCSVPTLRCVRLKVANLSQSDIVVVDGSALVGTAGGGKVNALPFAKVYTAMREKPKKTFRRKELVATVATAGLGSLMVAEQMQNKNDPAQGWLGSVARKRTMKDTLFEARSILPYDHSEGLVYFPGTNGDITSVKLRVGAQEQDVPVQLSRL